MIDIYQHQFSPLHVINTRVKSIFTLVFILCISLSPSGSWPAYILFLTLIASGILLSHLNIKKLLLRSLISVPFVLAAFPLLFSGLEPHQHFMIMDHFNLTISQPGSIRFVSIAIKSWLSLMAVILLSSSTRFEDLLSAFRQLGLPKLLVAILSLMWRYLSLMVDEAMSLAKARDSRSAGKSGRGTLAWRAGVTGKMVGNLLLRSLERSERVYAAMSSRGYTGEPCFQTSSRLTKRDYFILSIGILLCLAILAIAFLSH
ncbi:MAG: cobalt ECF transporter T component CbiQ [Anaerolinea sp.]|nr:cobalt ECF transporter T component CbiQ [Anaerolinea sp.]